MLENKEIQKVGSDKVKHVDVRVLAASHKALDKQVAQGLFREDLYYRLNVIPLTSPALRERSSDIPLLVKYFSHQIAKRLGVQAKQIDPNCYQILKKYAWPGNIRELQNVIERMVILSGHRIEMADIPAEIALYDESDIDANEDFSLKDFNRMAEREFIVKKLKHYGGNITKTAEALQIDRSHLHKKLDQYGIKKTSSFT